MLKVIVIENLFCALYVELFFSIWFSIIIFSYRAIHLSILKQTMKRAENIKHFNPKKKPVLSGVSALFTCSGAPPTSFFLGLKMFRANHVSYIEVGDGCWRPNVLVTSLRCWWPIWYIGKITNITTKVANIMILPPTSQIGRRHTVTNLTMSSLG